MNEKSFHFVRNPRIDSFRGWGCLLILILHSLKPYIVDWDLIFQESDVINLGVNTVSLFFCVSGYLVYQSVEKLSALHKRHKQVFYIQRFFRIIPLWWFLILFMYLLGTFSGSVFLSQFFFYFGFLSYRPEHLPIVPAWSLFVEEIFYLGLPWMHQFMNSLKKVFVVFILSIFISILWKNGAPLLGVPTDNYFISRNILLKIPFFVSGILILQLERYFLKRDMGLIIQNGFILSAFGLISFLMLFHHYYIYAIITVPTFCFVCLQPQNIFSCTEHIRFLRYVGERCYSIYILHVPISMITPKQQLLLRSYLKLSDSDFRWGLVHALFILVLTLVASVISYRFIEKPFLHWGYILSNRWKNTRSS